MNNEAHNIEGCIAMFLSCHCVITNYDHMVNMLKHNMSKCKAIDDVKTHRTKCTNIIIDVLCPHFEEELTDDIGSNMLSLSLHESNDIPIVINYLVYQLYTLGMHPIKVNPLFYNTHNWKNVMQAALLTSY